MCGEASTVETTKRCMLSVSVSNELLGLLGSQYSLNVRELKKYRSLRPLSDPIFYFHITH